MSNEFARALTLAAGFLFSLVICALFTALLYHKLSNAADSIRTVSTHEQAQVFAKVVR